ncbi:MBL fold metallo-hydrolase [Rhodovulum sulfidophilum]|uniref:MBL fold metallo-hydrolase n=1 Tax=Rhodovulum visakhapatnamense TaxID=364297 RepID=A0ABS1REG2_9RHOB|nr:MBL fold metallo-hydrolase [Rhodovulum visakhapatnamense]MBL3577665.1 MBL fold metallo-hydrolase [Rhodovulum visakhapatnamense]OLS43334.1 MBL fold metallo-hydrolase [Rhodovulum sulfidophilum]
MARLTAISGLGRKSAAIFLIEMSGRRVLFDLGDGLEPGDRPDLTGIGRVDAVVLSHAHEDHAGALDRLDEVGDPPVLATARTLGFLPERLRAGRARVLPERGRVDLMGLDLTLGRAGHAPGGVWLHVATPAGGLLYTGDICPEAPRLPVDPLPEAATLVLDASYGDREGRLADQIAAMARAAAAGAVLCCPAAGRGADMVAALAGAGLCVATDAVIGREVAAATGTLPEIVDAATARPDRAIVCVSSNAERGLAAELLGREGFRFVFSSHVPDGTPARRMLDAGQALWLPWNVHPTLPDLLALVRTTGARRVLPAFLDIATAPRLAEGLGARLWTHPETEI